MTAGTPNALVVFPEVYFLSASGRNLWRGRLTFPSVCDPTLLPKFGPPAVALLPRYRSGLTSRVRGGLCVWGAYHERRHRPFVWFLRIRFRYGDHDRRREFAHLSDAAERIIPSVIGLTRDLGGSCDQGGQMTKAAQCRAKAAEYAQLALQMRDCDLRKVYQEFARHWREAANRRERPVKLAALKGGRA
jgi:hypothetical protein